MTRVVLAGGGYAHLFVLESALRGALAGCELVVVSPEEPLSCTEMLPGVVAGRISAESAVIDIRRLTDRVRGRFVHDRVARVDAAGRVLTLESGERLGYDLLSLSVTADLAGHDLPGVAEHAMPARPLSGALAISAALDRAMTQPGPEPFRVVVVGAGPSGVELALAARARLDRQGNVAAAVTILEAGHTVLPIAPPQAQSEARRTLKRADVTLRAATAVAEVGPGHLKLVGDGVLPADLLIWATGTVAPPLFRASGLPTESHGFLLIDESLRVIGHPRILGSGDGVVLDAWRHAPRSGAAAVRQGPVLAANLALLAADPDAARGFRHFRPRRRALNLMATGDGRAILSYDPVVMRGAWVLGLKDRMDRRFVARFGS
ncbi:MAG TPA: FAD-dependent oxidoreductase [Gemmatimonadales bacterium]|nr:FAD-dependent oxidoreductase [Gemmatimonadales bacterium]